MASSPTQLKAATATDARMVRTREALRGSFLKLLQEKPLDQITIRDIAAGADINYATFFRHHATKESLLHEIAEQQVRTLSSLMLPSLDASDMSAASLALCNYVEAHRSLWSTLLTGGAASVFREELLRIAREVAITRSNPNSWVPPELAISFHVSGTVELLTWWLRQERPVPTQRVADLLQHVVLMPIHVANQKFAGAGPAKSAAGKKRKGRAKS
jgi:AcrR family transcriptional regulator